MDGRARSTRREFLAATGGVLTTVGTAALLPGCGRDPVTPGTPAPQPEFGAFDGHQAETLLALARDLFPGPGLELSHHRAVLARLDQLAADPATRGLLTAGVAALDEGDGAWASRAPSVRIVRLGELESTPFFQFVRYQAMSTIYSDPSVWALYGYEGESISKGGYLRRGFDDLDWLPEPEPAPPWPS